jgi:hypothetical protein
VRAGAVSIALILIVHALLMPTQGHGWGFRYLHPALAFFSLLAVHGAHQLHQRLSTASARHFWSTVRLLALVSLAALPLRAIQVESFVRPFWSSSELISHSAAEIVIVDDHRLWFGVDLVRNDPDLSNRPLVLSGRMLAPQHLLYLCSRFRLEFVDQGDLSQFGMETVPLRPTQPPLAYIASQVGCSRIPPEIKP